MFKWALPLALIAVVLAASVEEDFQAFKVKYNKSYSSAEEETARFEIFKEGIKRAAYLNSLPGQTATYGVTKFSDLTPLEFKQFYLITKPLEKPEAPVVETLPDVPKATSFDWNTKGVITPVKNQLQCGSCWAFSATETIESVWKLAGHSLPTLGPQQIVDCDTTDDGCGGGWPYNAYQYVISAGGQESEASYPYTGQDGYCEFQASKVVAKITSWKYITQNMDENQMENYLVSKGPMSVCVDAESWQYYQGGVITKGSGCGTSIDHCVQVTGYATKSGTKAWHVRNSWGTSWGENGYLWVQMGQDVCAIAQVVTTPIA